MQRNGAIRKGSIRVKGHTTRQDNPMNMIVSVIQYFVGFGDRDTLTVPHGADQYCNQLKMQQNSCSRGAPNGSLSSSSSSCSVSSDISSKNSDKEKPIHKATRRSRSSDSNSNHNPLEVMRSVVTASRRRKSLSPLRNDSFDMESLKGGGASVSSTKPGSWERRVKHMVVLLAWVWLLQVVSKLIIRGVRDQWDSSIRNLMQIQEEEIRLKQMQTSEQLKQEFNQFRSELNESIRQENAQHQKEVNHLINYYKTNMQQSIKMLSKRDLVAKYGVGPHYVEMQVVVDPDSNIAQEDNPVEKIIIELAPIELMPHTVYWFLEQVSHKLYDGSSFHTRYRHVLQAGPTGRNFMSRKGEDLYRKFEETGLANILFQEYSPSFPHYQYTLGYAGRPGGPDFYISMKDNSKVHGPGGQTAYDDPNEADPCFAKVIDGFHIIDRMHQSDVVDNAYQNMKHNVAIKQIRILDTTKEGLPATAKV